MKNVFMIIKWITSHVRLSSNHEGEERSTLIGTAVAHSITAVRVRQHQVPAITFQLGQKQKLELMSLPITQISSD